MKKLLALVLALVMTLGLATVGASAAATKYADADKINYTEAVDVLSAIGVLDGKDGGQFDPATTLKRSEGAKIVAYLLLGNKAAENLKGSGSKFSDVPANHWAAGYIEYLASEGVLGGVGDGKFNPDGTLTTTQFAKMLLTALGYDAEIEKLGGPDWAINTQKIANRVDLFKGNADAAPNDAVKREEAALYAFNTLKTPIVEYDNNMRVADANGSTIIVGSSNAKPVQTQATYRNAISNKTASINGNNPQPMLEFGEEYYKGDLRRIGQGAQQYNDFGQPINKWTYKNIEIGKYVDSASMVASFTKKVTAKTLYDTIGKDRVDSILSNESTISLWNNGVETSYGKGTTNQTGSVNPGNKTFVQENILSRNDTVKINGTGNGSFTEVYVNDDDNTITVVSYHTYVYKAIDNYNKDTGRITVESAGDTDFKMGAVTLAGGEANLSDKDYPQIADYKSGDYILLNVYHTTAAGAYRVGKVAKATLLTGTVNGYKVDGNVTIDGQQYDYSEMTAKSTEAGNDKVRGTAYNAGTKTTVVLDTNGYVIAVEEAMVDANYVFVTKFGSPSGLGNGLVANAFFADGTKSEITIDKVYDATSTEITAATLKTPVVFASTTEMDNTAGNTFSVQYAGWYTYSKGSDGKYTLTAPLTSNNRAQAASAEDSKGATKLVENNKVLSFANMTDGNNAAGSLNFAGTTVDSIRTNAKTVFVVYNEATEEVFTYTGSANAPDVKANGAGEVFVMAVYNSNNSYATHVFVSVSDGATIEDNANTALLYVVKQDGKFVKSNNEVYYKWKVIDENSKIVTIDSKVNIGWKYRALFKVTKNADDMIKTATQITTNAYAGPLSAGAALTYDGKYIDIQGASNGAYDGDTAGGQIYYKDETLWLAGQAFTLAKNAKVTLVITNGIPALLDDKGADEEVHPMTASSLYSKLKLYPTAQYSAQARLTDKWADDNSREIQELYVTVTGQTANTVAGGGDVTSAVRSALAASGTTNVTVTGTGTSTISSDITLKAGQTLNVAGTLNVAAGAKITIPAGAFLTTGTLAINGDVVNNGSLTSTNTVINGNSLHNTGTANLGATTVNGSLENQGKIKATTINVASSATVTIGPSATIKATGAVTNASANVTVNGELDSLTTITTTAAFKGTGKVQDKDGKIENAGTSVTVGVYGVAADTTPKTLKVAK